jgi:predicted nucleic-acid-binding Zn-ribbon protein
MKNGCCPMCQSTDIYTNPTVNFRASGSYVDLEDHSGREDLGITFIPYLCLRCGFTAMYVESLDELEDLPKTEGWKKVMP